MIKQTLPAVPPVTGREEPHPLDRREVRVHAGTMDPYDLQQQGIRLAARVRTGHLRSRLDAPFRFGLEVPVCRDGHGRLMVLVDDSRPHAHLVLQNTPVVLALGTTPGLRLDVPGNLVLVPPGEVNALARAQRYHGGDIDNISRGARRLYRLAADELAVLTGEGRPTALATGSLTHGSDRLVPREEDRLLGVARDSHALRSRLEDHLGQPSHAWSVVGIDPLGLDVRTRDGRFARIDFATASRSPDDLRRRLECPDSLRAAAVT